MLGLATSEQESRKAASAALPLQNESTHQINNARHQPRALLFYNPVLSTAPAAQFHHSPLSYSSNPLQMRICARAQRYTKLSVRQDGFSAAKCFPWRNALSAPTQALPMDANICQASQVLSPICFNGSFFCLGV